MPLTLKLQAKRMKFVVASVGFLWLLREASSFAGLPVARNPSRSNLHVHRELQDMEEARAAFECLMAEHELLPENVLTATSRRRRQLEMKLLRQLKDSDEAVEELMRLWMSEHGSNPAAVLEEMEEVASPGLVREQEVLSAMMEEYRCWAEPRMRLATVLYFKGETDKARELAMASLKLKPWHFESMQLLILLALRDGNMGEALAYARQSLPPIGSKRRKSWVQRAVHEAEKQWEELLTAHTGVSDMETEAWQ